MTSFTRWRKGAYCTPNSLTTRLLSIRKLPEIFRPPVLLLEADIRVRQELLHERRQLAQLTVAPPEL